MKKIIFVAVVLLLAFFYQMPVLAQETVTPDTSGVLGIQTIEYTLPYPGLLPDHPLYPLKALRDKLVSFLIADPIKKAEFDVLQSDKRLVASMMLSQKKPVKENLVINTLSKGENYFSESIDQVSFAKKQGAQTADILGKLTISNKKHLEVIEEMEQTASSSLRTKLGKEKSRVVKFAELVNKLGDKK